MGASAAAEVATVREALPQLAPETVEALDRSQDVAAVLELAAGLEEREAAIIRAIVAAVEQARQEEEDDLTALLMALL
jgi:hypothetical protein